MYLASIIWGSWVLVLSASGLSGPYGIYVVAGTWGFGTLGFAAICAAGGNLGNLGRLVRDWRVMRWAVLVGVMDAIHSALFLTGFQMAIADGGSMLVPVIRSLSGVCTPLVALFLSRGERFSPWYLAVGAVATAGALCIFGWSGFNVGEQISLLALGLVFASMLLACMIMLLARVLAVEAEAGGYRQISILTVQGVSEVLVLLPMVVALPFLFPIPLPEALWAKTAALLAIVGLTHVTLASMGRLHALKSISGQHSAIIGYLEPIISVALSILFLGEKATPGFVIGSAMILGAAAGAQYVALRHSALKQTISP